mgnify:CR=1 FL=1
MTAAVETQAKPTTYKLAVKFCEATEDPTHILKDTVTFIKKGQTPLQALQEYANYYSPEEVSAFGQTLVTRGDVLAVDFAVCMVYSCVLKSKVNHQPGNYKTLAVAFCDYAILTYQQPDEKFIKTKFNL